MSSEPRLDDETLALIRENGDARVAAYRADLEAKVRALDFPELVPCWCTGFSEEGDARGDTIGKCDACHHWSAKHRPGGCSGIVRVRLQPEAVRAAVLRLLTDGAEPPKGTKP